MGFMRPLRLFCAVLAALLLSACAQGTAAPGSPVQEPEDITAVTPNDPSITPEEGAAILEAQLGTVDAATGNAMSYGYEGTLTLDGVDYYNYRVSWLVNGDHLSYLTNYLVSTDGLVVQEYLPEAG